MYYMLHTSCRTIKLYKHPTFCILQTIGRTAPTSSKSWAKVEPQPDLKGSSTTSTVQSLDRSQSLLRQNGTKIPSTSASSAAPAVSSLVISPTLTPLSASLPEVVTTTTSTTVGDKSRKRRNKTVVLPEPDWQETKVELKQLPGCYLKLAKARLTTLVVLTSMAGYAMAPAPFELSSFLICSVGTGLVSSAANAINQYHEVPFDAQMSRTKNRVLVRGVLSPLHALGFALVSSSLGTAMLYFGVNGLTAALGLFNLVLYTSVYTPMKRISIANTWVGSVVGAIPPLMGWASCTGSLEMGALLLSGVLFTWQFPHFNALSWNLRPDYSRAGYRMMAVTNPGLCRRTTLRYTIALLAVSCAGPFLDVTNYWFALESIPLNAYFTYLAWKFYKESDSSSSRKLFRFSLLHLPALMILMLLNKKYWAHVSDSKDTPSVDSSVQQSLEALLTPSNPGAAAVLGLNLVPVIDTAKT